MAQQPPGDPYQPPPGFWGNSPGTPPPAQPGSYGAMPYQQPGYGAPGYWQPPKQRSTWKWVLGGCGGCAVLFIAVIVVLAVVGVNAVKNAPLANLPQPPGTSQTGISLNATSGHSEEVATYSSSETIDQVQAFYSTALNTGGWTMDTSQSTATTLFFHRSDHPNETGTMTLSSLSSGTQIRVVYDY